MIPTHTRRAVKIRAGGCCEDCGQRLPLTLHHLHYDTVGRESPDDLQALCWGCHQAKHRLPNGDYERDPIEVAEQWNHYHHDCGKCD